MNKEGYKDPTADRAIAHAEHIPKHVRQVLDVLEQAAGIAGFRIKSIEIQDRATKARFRRRG
ncbi:hypothetical protein [Faecalimonas umbilicata]|uniref:hypothetical protein n=1 Tax=Faecalimonas umbilicata TaxID=1912855 RepID=UPI002943158F|nr:hypothetical protein [Faecalimonas umbilicata]